MTYHAVVGEYERGLMDRLMDVRSRLGVAKPLQGFVRRPAAPVILPPDVEERLALDDRPVAKSKKHRQAGPRRERRGIGYYSSAWRTILETVCAAHRLHPRDVLGPSRTRIIVACRHEAMWEIYRRTRMSLPQIGYRFSRDHTCVLLAVRKFEKPIGVKVDIPTIPTIRHSMAAQTLVSDSTAGA
jgi:hypothetical protein